MKYEIAEKIGENARKTSIHGRLKMFTVQDAIYRANDPSPSNYKIKEEIVRKKSPSSGIGFGKKLDFTRNKEMESVPGPIYDIGGFCEKFKSLQSKNKCRINPPFKWSNNNNICHKLWISNCFKI